MTDGDHIRNTKPHGKREPSRALPATINKLIFSPEYTILFSLKYSLIIKKPR